MKQLLFYFVGIDRDKIDLLNKKDAVSKTPNDEKYVLNFKLCGYYFI